MGRESRRTGKTTVEQLRELDRRGDVTRSGLWFLNHPRFGAALITVCYPFYVLASAIGGIRTGHRAWLHDRQIWKELQP